MKKMFKKLLCKLNLHSWKSTKNWTWKCENCSFEENQTTREKLELHRIRG